MSGPRYAAALLSVLATVLWLEVSLGRAVPPRVPLEAFPQRIGRWSGWPEVPDADTIRRTRPDEFLSRRYTDPSGRIVALYVAYFGRDASRARIQAACWGDCRIRERGFHSLRLDRDVVRVNRALVVQDGEPTAVLYWFQQGRAVVTEPAGGRLEGARRALLMRRSDGALVRVSAPVATGVGEAVARAEEFARAVLPVILRHMPE